jgi:hypothetical protein
VIHSGFLFLRRLNDCNLYTLAALSFIDPTIILVSDYLADAEDLLR